MTYTYEIYPKTDTHNERYNTARKELSGEGQDAYILSRDGEPFMIQFEKNLPYPGTSLEESAQNHIAALIAEQPQE